MTLDEAYEYVDQAHNAEGEQRAEFGMGAVSMGFDGNEAMLSYDGYRSGLDPMYAEARRIIEAHEATIPMTPLLRTSFDGDDIPF
jgi:hypothetical protein